MFVWQAAASMTLSNRTKTFLNNTHVFAYGPADEHDYNQLLNEIFPSCIHDGTKLYSREKSFPHTIKKNCKVNSSSDFDKAIRPYN